MKRTHLTIDALIWLPLLCVGQVSLIFLRSDWTASQLHSLHLGIRSEGNTGNTTTISRHEITFRTSPTSSWTAFPRLPLPGLAWPGLVAWPFLRFFARFCLFAFLPFFVLFWLWRRDGLKKNLTKQPANLRLLFAFPFASSLINDLNLFERPCRPL